MIVEQLTAAGAAFVTDLLVKWLKQMYQNYGIFRIYNPALPYFSISSDSIEENNTSLLLFILGTFNKTL
jgi:hypothetical protein